MSLSEEESNFLRFNYLNLKVASKAVRVYFDSVHPPAGLVSELANSSATLKALRFITKIQLQTLYPNSASNVRSEKFDTTLIVCLLRNMTPRETAPVTGWDKLPHPGDTSTGADLARVKWYRNKLAHDGEGKLSPSDFSQYWGDLECAIGRLGGPLLLREAQYAQHIVLDKSHIDILNSLHNLQSSLEEHTSMINNLQSIFDQKTTTKEEHELKDQHLNDSPERREVDAQKVASDVCDIQVPIEICTRQVDVCRKDIEKTERKIKEIEEKVINKQDSLDDLTVQLLSLECNYDIEFKEIDKRLTKQVEHMVNQDKFMAEQNEHMTKQDKQLTKQDKQLTKQDKQLTNHTEQMAKQDEQMAKQDEQMANQDELIATCVKDIDDMKKKACDTDDSQEGRKRKRLMDDTDALIVEDLREGTFVITKAVADGLSLLKQNGVLLITGYAGTGKSRIGRHVLHMYCTDDITYNCIKLNTLDEWEDMVNREHNVAILLDDIFGETNCMYNREKDLPILDKVYAYVCKGSIKVIITIRDTVKRQCHEVFESNRLFRFECIDLSSEKYKLSLKEKFTFLEKYMNIVLQSKFAGDAGFVDCNGITVLQKYEAWKISNESPVKGFPLAIYQFVNNAKYFQLGVNFFDRPTHVMLEELKEIRRKGEDHRKYKLQYAVMVYTAISGNCINPDKSFDREGVEKIIDAIYGGNIKLKKCNISDTIHDIKGSYLVIEPNQTSYRLHHQTLLESVIISFAQIDEEHIKDIIPLLSWSFIQKMVKPDTYNERDGEVVLKIPTTSYEILALKLMDIYKKCFNGQIGFSLDSFLDGFIKTEMFQQDFYRILRYILKAAMQDDNKYEDTKYLIKFMSSEMCSISSDVHVKSTTFLLCTLLMSVAKAERQFDIYDSILQMLNQIYKNSNDFVTIAHIKGTFVTSLYEMCATKDVRCVKATLNLVKENKIPVFLDQVINLTIIGYESYYLRSNKTNCIFLTFCIWKAYEALNVPVMEYLLSLYNDTRFDVNLFLKFIYRTDFIMLSETRSSLSHICRKPLKWMVERYEDQQFVETDFILPIACLYRLFDTVKYLVTRCNVFDAVLCLKQFLNDYDYIDALDHSSHYNEYKDLYHFLFPLIDITSSEMNSIIISILQKPNIPDYFFDTLLPVCIDNGDLLNTACKEGHLYIATIILEKSQNVSIQSALISACMEENIFEYYSRIDDEKLKIVKYIIGKYGCEQFDLKAVCEQACHSKKFKIMEWFVQNIDITLLNVNCILESALLCKESDLLEYISLHKIEIVSLDKNKVLKSLIKHFTAKYSTKILEIVSVVWDSTENKEEIKIKEMVETAYEVECFEMLIWIHEHCNSRIAINASRVLVLACAKSRVDIAKWVLKTFEEKSFDINEKKLLMLPVDAISSFMKIEMIDTMEWVLETFQIPPLHLKECVLKLISLNECVQFSIRLSYQFFDLILSIFQKYRSLFSSEDMGEIMNTALENSYLRLVNWFLEHMTSCSFDKQHILNKACSATNTLNFETVMILTKSFHSLDTNQAFVQACIHNQQLICKHLLGHIRPNAVDKGTLVSSICQENVSDDIIKWILQYLPLGQISVNKVLISFCQKGKFDFVQYIFQTEDNEKLHTVSAFLNACLNPYEYKRDQKESLRVIDFLFKKLPDKLYSLSFVLNGLLAKKSHAVILYFLEQGYFRSIDMKNLLNEVCRYGHSQLVQWILENIDHTELDIQSAFYNACTTKDVCMYSDVKLHCVVLFKHYIQDMFVFDLDPILKIINETPSDFPNQYDDLINCVLNIKTLRGDEIEK